MISNSGMTVARQLSRLVVDMHKQQGISKEAILCGLGKYLSRMGREQRDAVEYAERAEVTEEIERWFKTEKDAAHRDTLLEAVELMRKEREGGTDR